MFPKIGGKPPKWPIKMDDLGVFPYFWKHPYAIYVSFEGVLLGHQALERPERADLGQPVLGGFFGVTDVAQVGVTVYQSYPNSATGEVSDQKKRPKNR